MKSQENFNYRIYLRISQSALK